MNVRNNKRSQDTEARVEEVFLQLLSQKHISRITVRELCEGAHITRTSFYGHYKDVYELLERVQERITCQATSIFLAEWGDHDRDVHMAFVQTFRYIEQNKVFFRYFLKNADLGVVFSAAQVAGLFGSSLTREKKLYLTFFVGGLNALLVHWLEGDCEERPEELLKALSEENIRIL